MKENRDPNIRKSVPTDFCCRYDIIFTNYIGNERNDYFYLLEWPKIPDLALNFPRPSQKFVKVSGKSHILTD